MNRKLRNILFRIHLWLGLHLSVFFTLMFLTGTFLVAGVELTSIGRPGIWTTIAKEDRTASFGAIYDGIKRTHPESSVFVIEKHPAPWFAVLSYGRTGWGEPVNFWTDPSTGQVAAAYEATTPNLRSIVREFHDSFLTGKTAVFLLICSTSVLLFFQIVSGLITYRRFWKGFFRWPSRSGGLRSWAGGFHRLAAVWATPLIVVIAVTSFYFMFEELGFKSSYPTPQSPVARSSTLPPGFDAALIDRAEAQARAALPNFEPTVLVLPRDISEGLEFIDHVKGVSEFWGERVVLIDPATLDILGAFTPEDNGGLARWNYMMNVLHYGTWGGAFSIVLWVFLGLAAIGVAFSGALIFAARLDPEAAQYGPLRRVWRGMGIFRWAYVLLLLGVLFAGYARHGPGSQVSTVVHPIDASGSEARLVLRSPFRHGTPLDIELLVGETGVDTASVAFNGDAAQPVDLLPHEATAQAYFRYEPDISENEITARLTKKDGTERIVTFRMGRPIW